MAENTTVGPTPGQTSVADVIELARRDIARTQTDFLGRMNACLMDYEAICDDHPDGDFGDDKQEADEAISSLAGLALAQVMMLRGEEAPTDNLIAAAPELYEALKDARQVIAILSELLTEDIVDACVGNPMFLIDAALLKASPRAGEGV